MSIVLDVKDLTVDYIVAGGRHVRAVDHVSFQIREGESLGLAGESGCGKSTVAYSLLRLHKPPALINNGQIIIDGQDILKMSKDELAKFRWSQASMVFQSAMNCLNPVVSLEKQFYDLYKQHGITKNRAVSKQKAMALLELVGIPAGRISDYPHQFSGGMRQRAVIAMALALKPKLLILDEPTTALDTVVQRDILSRIYELKDELNFSILFITHDISLMMEFCDNVAIMYAGKIIEKATSEKILNAPKHPYSFGLKNSFPSLQGEIKYMEGIKGNPLDLNNIPKGCRFQERCFKVQEFCSLQEPERVHEGESFYQCHFPLIEQEEATNDK
ncbi:MULTISPECIES: ABC transporter ATP-binding protein [unclassified Fusibacter]|uniref:ABC transporter ATP-binding protein n=1 Tax=unclassified Fusibacter TaxID=2624464 RepID=UPI001012222F|nr:MULTISPECIES: ABC transporter ATP-binding protein [unclassified Fusibacter]MCK8061673.1 ABC transporter ATP-binding protein [Fusibacter sp. A2]NPE23857.1 ABC transporter ATP-binding protein [Fusibacter sp. A1]RXV58572.1 ABC transporter ATP-binding protein [Fusibacter sp. A1]